MQTQPNKSDKFKWTCPKVFSLLLAATFLFLACNTSDDDGGTSTVNIAVSTDPAITSAAYDAASGALALTGINLPGAGLDFTKIKIVGHGAEYTLDAGSGGDTTSAAYTSTTAITLTVAGTIKNAVNGVLNKNGTSSASAPPVTYNLKFEAGAFGPTAPSSVDVTSNAVTVSKIPAVTRVIYRVNPGEYNDLLIRGTNLPGAGLDVTKIIVTGEGGDYTLVVGSADDGTTADYGGAGTTIILIVTGTVEAALNAKIDKNGESSSGGTVYNLKFEAGAFGETFPTSVSPTNTISRE